MSEELNTEYRKMRKRHCHEQDFEDAAMKVVFAVMCPLVILTPWFWKKL